MWCPECRSEFREGISRCANCEVDLVSEPPSSDVFASPESMADALRGKEVQALMVGQHTALQEGQRILAKAKIPSVIAGESDEVETAMHARFFLMVAEGDVESARGVFKDRWAEGLATEGLMFKEDAEATADGLSSDACPACGTALSATDEECPECGLFVGAAGGEEEGEEESS